MITTFTLTQHVYICSLTHIASYKDISYNYDRTPVCSVHRESLRDHNGVSHQQLRRSGHSLLLGSLGVLPLSNIAVAASLITT